MENQNLTTPSSISSIIDDVTAEYGITREELKGRSRDPHLIKARMVVARRLKAERGLSNSDIGATLNRSWWQVNYYINDTYREKKKSRYISCGDRLVNIQQTHSRPVP